LLSQLLVQPSTQSPKSAGSRSRAERRRKPQPPADYIATFFAEYPTFDYDSSAEMWTEFDRMCDAFRWDSDDYEMREARRKFKSAMVQQFNILYGTDVEDLNSWKNLCGILNIVPVPADLKKCREVSLPFLFFIPSRSFLYSSIPRLGMSSD
jgi:hypothetical protein